MHIRRAQLADAFDIATVINRAMWDDPFSDFRFRYRNQYPFMTAYHTLRRTRRRFYEGKFMLVMVTDEDDVEWEGKEKILACLTLVRQVENAEGSLGWDSWLNLQLHWIEDQFIWHLRLDRSSSRPAILEFQQKIQENTVLKNYPQNYELEGLQVHPDHQRRGIGGQLLREAQSMVAKDDAHVPLVLVASAKGEGLYRKHGFKNIGRYHFGGEAYGEAMVWEPPMGKCE